MPVLCPDPFLLTAKRDLDAAKRFFRKMLADQPLLAPDRIGTDGASTESKIKAWMRQHIVTLIAA